MSEETKTPEKTAEKYEEQTIYGKKMKIRLGSLPVPTAKLKGTPQEEILRIWARQSKQGLVTLCAVEGCYYPLSPVRDPARDNEPMVKTDEKGKKYIVGHCSWAGEEHGEQRIYPPKKEDEL